MRGGRILWGQIAVVLTIVLVMTWAATQWTAWRLVEAAEPSIGGIASNRDGNPANAGIRREPELPEQEEIIPPPPSPAQEFEPLDEESDVDAAKANAMRARMRMVARQASLDPGDGIEL